MCEKCKERREEMWTEIRDLMNYNRRARGPLAEMLHDGISSFCEEHPNYSEDEIRAASDGLRAQFIAIRCAFIARSCPETEFHGAPPSIILGSWAGEAMRMEQSSGIVHELLGRLFEGD